MTKLRLAFAVAVGLVALSDPAGASAASDNGAWSYVVANATGTVAWQYSGPGASGAESVTFQGRPRRKTGMLQGRATYVDQNTRGCGPVSHTRIANFRRPSFVVHGAYVVVTWSVPLPSQSYCGAAASSVAKPRATVASETIPLSRFTCPALSLRLTGLAITPEGSSTGELKYQMTVVLTNVIRISV